MYLLYVVFIFSLFSSLLFFFFFNWQKLKKSGKEPEVFVMDVSCKLDIMKPKITAILNKYKRIDILVNNAGVSFRGEVRKCFFFFVHNY